jgi:hypothetical protein
MAHSSEDPFHLPATAVTVRPSAFRRLWANDGPFRQNFKSKEVLSSSPANIGGLSFKTVANQLTHLDEHVFMLRVPNNEGALPILFTFHKLKAT